jgi:hypothetical protein
MTTWSRIGELSGTGFLRLCSARDSKGRQDRPQQPPGAEARLMKRGKIAASGLPGAVAGTRGGAPEIRGRIIRFSAKNR